MTTLSPKDAIEWRTSHYLLCITESQCIHCSRKERASELFLVCERRGKYAKQTTKRLSVTRYPLAYLNIARRTSVRKAKTPYCAECWAEREAQPTKSSNKLVMIKAGLTEEQRLVRDLNIDLEGLGL